jgi:hypothetical protein
MKYKLFQDTYFSYLVVLLYQHTPGTTEKNCEASDERTGLLAYIDKTGVQLTLWSGVHFETYTFCHLVKNVAVL